MKPQPQGSPRAEHVRAPHAHPRAQACATRQRRTQAHGSAHVAAARARGISESRILVRHAFRPASISLMTVLGISTGRLLGGTVVVETLFSLPGLGLLLQQSILQRDLIMVQGIVVFLAATYVLVNLVVDLLYGVVDPRIRARLGR